MIDEQTLIAILTLMPASEEKLRLEKEDVSAILKELFSLESDSDVETIYDATTKRLKGERDLKKIPFKELQSTDKGLVLIGGGGVVLQCHKTVGKSKKNRRRISYALKVARPSLFPGDVLYKDVMQEQHRTRGEFIKQAPLSHRNICRVFDMGDVAIPFASNEMEASVDCVAMLLEWIEGAQPLSSYFLNFDRKLSHLEVVDLISQCFEGLHVLHENNLIHWDMKADNILVDRTGVVKITDLGNARHRAGGNESTAQSTVWNLPPKLRSLVLWPKEGKVFQSKRANVQVGSDSEYDAPWLDLWMLAFELNRLFQADATLLGQKRSNDTFQNTNATELAAGVAPSGANDISYPAAPYDAKKSSEFLNQRFPGDNEEATFTLEFIRLVLRRLLKPTGPDDAPFYSSAKDVAADLRKLEPEFGAAQNVSELRAVPQHVLRLPTTGNSVFTARVGRFFNSALMRRVSQHLQLSTLKHVYPGAEHKRSEHIMGVLNTTVEFVRALYADRGNPFWRISMEAVDIEALLVAALCHDLGHVAFGHYLEELSGMFKGRMHEDYALALLDPEHRTAFGPLVRARLEKDRVVLRDLIANEWGTAEQPEAFMKRVATILQSPVEEPARNRRELPAVMRDDGVLRRDSSNILKHEILQSIINSALDADKLDYLLRDSLHCGVRYGSGIDLQRFYQSLTTLTHLPPKIALRTSETFRDATAGARRACVAMSDKGILPLEAVLLSRYQMFVAVYWHHTARTETVLLQFLITKLLENAKTEALAVRRLDELIDTFRSEDDQTALRWLTRQCTAIRMPERERAIVENACKALDGFREFLYWHAFELQYEGPGPSGEYLKASAKRLYEELADQFDVWSGAMGLVDGVTALSRKRREIGDSLILKLGLSDFQIGDGELLVDIPPKGKDQIKNVYICMGDQTKTIQETSPIAEAVSDAFQYWSRRLRVFLAPALWKRLEERGIDGAKVRAAAHEVMAYYPLSLLRDRSVERAPRKPTSKRRRKR